MGIGISCMDDDEYVLLDYPNGKEIRNGPGVTSYFLASAKKSKMPRINNDEYFEIEHLTPIKGSLVETIPGPMLYKIDDPYAKIIGIKNKIRLNPDEYIIVTDINGKQQTISGEALYTPKPYDKCSAITKKLKLTATQYTVIVSEMDGSRKVVVGPSLQHLQPLEYHEGVKDMIVLNETDYLYITHTDTGKIGIEEGPKKFTPGPYDKLSSIQRKIILQNNEYVKIVDQNTGIIRVVTGPATIVLKQFEKAHGNITKAHEVNDLTAVLIFDTTTGSYELITKHGMFVPTAVQNVIEVRSKIRLELNESMVIKDKKGKYIIMNGNDDTSSFFLPPYCDILEQIWTNTPDKHTGNLPIISTFDTRPQYMDYEFLVRTKDGVEIFLKLNFCWQITNVQKMITNTHNCPHDICIHAQSDILSAVSIVEMNAFMESFNEIIQSAMKDEDPFYELRGVKVIRSEIIGRSCKDLETEKIFQAIIKAKTDRIKNLEQQHGHNEVELAKIQGQIQQETLTGDLVSVKNTYLRRESAQMGESEGARISNFLEHLPKDLSEEQKVAIYMDIQNTKRVSEISHIPGLNLYLTPKELDFKMVNLNYTDKKVDPIIHALAN